MPSLWKCDDGDEDIKKLDETGNVLTSFSSPSGEPKGLGYDKTQTQFTILVGDGTDNDFASAIYEVDEVGSFNKLFFSSDFDFEGVGVDAGNSIWVYENFSANIEQRDRTGSVLTSFAGLGTFNGAGTAVDTAGSIWETDNSGTIGRFNRTGSIVSSFATPSDTPRGLGIESSDSLWHLDGPDFGSFIYELDWTGTVVNCFGLGGWGLGTEEEPIGVTTGGGTVTDTAVKDSQAFSPFQSTEVSEGTVSAVKEAFGFGTGKAQPAKVWFDTTEQWDSASGNAVSHSSDVVSITTGEDKGFIIPSQQNWEG